MFDFFLPSNQEQKSGGNTFISYMFQHAVKETLTNYTMKVKERMTRILRQRLESFFHATYQENCPINEEITQPINKSHNLSRNHATSWDSSQDSDP